jgi:GNAT superfamily N-acetyltransferase
MRVNNQFSREKVYNEAGKPIKRVHQRARHQPKTGTPDRRKEGSMTETLTFRSDQRTDLPEIVRLLADDELGSQRERYENPLPEAYDTAFGQIDGNPNLELIVAELDGQVVGTLQLIFIPSISFQGGLRAQVESVRVDKPLRNRGLGKQLMHWALERARERGAYVVQLTTHLSRTDAHRFYEQLGFNRSHLGMKISLK